MNRLLLFFFALCWQSSKAQPTDSYTFRHLGQREGLLHNTVLNITQDKKGFMWIASRNGLQRYDGFRFTNYEKEIRPLLRSSDIKNIDPVDDKTIWVASNQLACLQLSSNQVTIYNDSDLLNSKKIPFDVYTDNNHRKWWLSDYALYHQDSATQKRSLYCVFTPGRRSHLGNYVFFDKGRQCYWVVNYRRLMLFDKNTKKVYWKDQNAVQNSVLQSLPKEAVSLVLVDSEDNVWASQWQGNIFKFDSKTNTAKRYSLVSLKTGAGKMPQSNSPVTVLCLYEDDHGTLWAGTDHAGLLRFNKGRNEFETVPANDTQKQGIGPNNPVLCINQDAEGSLWLGTDKGISIFNPYRNYFEKIAHVEGNPRSLPDGEITSVFQGTNGTIYVSTWGGGFSLYDSAWHFKKTIAVKGPAEYRLDWCFAEADDGTVLVGAQHGYLLKYDPRHDRVKAVHPAEMENSTIVCMAKDKNGNVWFGLYNGKIVKWDKALSRFIKEANGEAELSTVKNLLPDGQNRVWAGTANGLLLVDATTLQRKGLYKLPNNADGRSYGSDIHGMEALNDSVLLLGTQHCGVYSFQTRTKTFMHYGPLSALQNANVYAVKHDGRHNLWISTDYDLYRFAEEPRKLLRYRMEPQRTSSAFNFHHFVPLQNGTWATTTQTETITFSPALLAITNANKKPVITGFKIFDTEMFIDSLLYAKNPVRLSSEQNFITVDFSNLVYSAVEESSFFYKLSGVDKDWVKTDGQGKAVYTNLAAGNYVFTVKANADDSAANITALAIIISPPFYLTWWFKALVVLLLALSVYFFMWWRIRAIRTKTSLLQKVAETEMMALRSQMNPHFIFNCLGAIDNLIQTAQTDKATTYLARFAKLIRAVLESSKNNVVQFYKDFETLKLYLNLEQFRSGDKFTYRLLADEELLNGDYKVPPLIVQPFVENAIHHGLMNKLDGERTLLVEATLQTDFIQYRISDNGVGREKAQELKFRNKPERSSYGIGITAERIALHNGEQKNANLRIDDVLIGEKVAGTSVTVKLKITNP